MLPERLEDSRTAGQQRRRRCSVSGLCACVRRSGGMRSCCDHDGRKRPTVLRTGSTAR
ncbi:Uncharacterized protein DAT39_019775 [Clarias magur]|uniref:Uncharacterized protein n=1 Tax=Clarias magur TaxID=1594786 RepID=A0A8J4X1P3_CLAMG|nr:Uncharacterized protein DAT39_019775 [Clarias magur]